MPLKPLSQTAREKVFLNQGFMHDVRVPTLNLGEKQYDIGVFYVKLKDDELVNFGRV